MRRVLMTVAAMAALAVATPAMASLVLNGDGCLRLAARVASQVIHLNGMTDGPTVIAGLTADLTMTFVNITNGGLTYNFTY